MAKDEHVRLLKQGVAAWNAWRDENPNIHPNLSDADLPENLSGANLRGADLSKANLNAAKRSGADLRAANVSEADLRVADLSKANLSAAKLSGADLRQADLRQANLSGATLHEADLFKADLSGAILSGAKLIAADLFKADLSGADLRRANLFIARLVDTDLTDAYLTGCCVYGASAWGLRLERAKQHDLIITNPAENEPEITVDNLEVAQFIYLLLNNQKIRDVIDTITSKTVLILGRFTAERKAVLDALREELRKRNYLPILFDFDVPATRDITETVSLLARMARFIVADITDARSIPQELAVIVPDLPSVPVQPLLLEGSAEYGMFEHFKCFPWVLETYKYPSSERLIASLGERVIGPAEQYAQSARK
jgi:uncharacterized protein YjbI with pentapeptide repeats